MYNAGKEYTYIIYMPKYPKHTQVHTFHLSKSNSRKRGLYIYIHIYI